MRAKQILINALSILPNTNSNRFLSISLGKQNRDENERGDRATTCQVLFFVIVKKITWIATYQKQVDLSSTKIFVIRAFFRYVVAVLLKKIDYGS